VAQDGRDAGGVELVREAVGLGDGLGRDEPARGDALAEELGRRQRLPVRQAALGEGAANLAAGVEDVAVRVAERAVLDPGLGVRYESSFFRMPRKPRKRRQ
jgi:hypothetical protein